MSYLTYNPATNRYPIRGFSNPNFAESPDAIPPPFTALTYQSNGDTNGVIYYLGTLGLTTSFSNPHTRGNVVVTSSSNIDGNRIASKATDRLNASDANIWHSVTTAAPHWIKVRFVEGTLALNKLVLQASYAHDFTNMGDCDIHGSNDDTNWTLIGNKTFSGAASSYDSFDTTITDPYQYIRVTKTSGSWAVLGELELYGHYYIN